MRGLQTVRPSRRSPVLCRLTMTTTMTTVTSIMMTIGDLSMPKTLTGSRFWKYSVFTVGRSTSGYATFAFDDARLAFILPFWPALLLMSTRTVEN